MRSSTSKSVSMDLSQKYGLFPSSKGGATSPDGGIQVSWDLMHE
uniref:Uncharacterized protein n=1 Tax=Anguilla anguilla TaxID=7936 RepID=A0A0E9Q6F8_ANGAN